MGSLSCLPSRLRAYWHRLLGLTLLSVALCNVDIANGTNSALLLDGATGMISGQQQLVTLGPEFTFEAWLRLAEHGTNTIISRNASDRVAPLEDWIFQVDESGHLGLFANGAWDQSNGTIPLNEWVHVAASANPAEKKFYINGQLDSRSLRPHPYGNGRSFGIVIGRQGVGCPCLYFKGTLDEVRIWTKARSDVDIAANYRRPLAGFETHLLRVYRFDDGTGQEARDDGPGNIPAQIFGEALWVPSSVPLLEMPAASTLAVSNVTHSAAILGGTVRPDGLPTYGWFEWGTGPGADYDGQSPVFELGTGRSAQRVTWALSNLNPRNSYHYRFVVTNALGILRGADERFSTPLFDFYSLPGSYGLTYSSLAWGDYDSDGWLDLLVTGVLNSTGVETYLLGNTKGTLAKMPSPFQGLAVSGMAWGDLDQDNSPELLRSGTSLAGQTTELWRYTEGVWEQLGNGLPALSPAALAWGDYDNDGRRDLLLAGRANGDSFVGVFRNTPAGFTQIAVHFPQVYGLYRLTAAWGDYDNDGRLDIALGSVVESETNTFCQIWRNTGTGFVLAESLPVTAVDGTVAWGDYDNDGRLDLLHTGGGSGTDYATIVFRNTPGGFVQLPTRIPSVFDTSAVWGDYDNDGKLDILLLGTRGSLWRNTGDDAFESSVEDTAGAPFSTLGETAWGDVDNDGRLDAVFSSSLSEGLLLWQNFNPVTNTAPDAPSGLALTLDGEIVRLRWNAALDAQTPGPGLSYNLRIGTAPGGYDVVSPLADPTTGQRRVAERGQVQGTQWFIRGLVPGRRYYWSVQAIDTAFAGGAWAAENSFIYEAPLRLNTPARLANGAVRLTWSGSGATLAHLFSSTDLVNWNDLGTGRAVDAEAAELVDVTAADAAQRFYQARKP